MEQSVFLAELPVKYFRCYSVGCTYGASSLAVVNQHNSAEIINGAKRPDTTCRSDLKSFGLEQGVKSFIDLYFMHFQLKSNRIAPEAYISTGFGTGFVLASLCQISAVGRDRL